MGLQDPICNLTLRWSGPVLAITSWRLGAASQPPALPVPTEGPLEGGFPCNGRNERELTIPLCSGVAEAAPSLQALPSPANGSRREPQPRKKPNESKGSPMLWSGGGGSEPPDTEGHQQNIVEKYTERAPHGRKLVVRFFFFPREFATPAIPWQF